MGLNGYRKYTSQFRRDTAIDKYVDLYERLMVDGVGGAIINNDVCKEGADL